MLRLLINHKFVYSRNRIELNEEESIALDEEDSEFVCSKDSRSLNREDLAYIID